MPSAQHHIGIKQGHLAAGMDGKVDMTTQSIPTELKDDATSLSVLEAFL